MQPGGWATVENWSFEKSEMSSTFKELRPTGLVLRSFAPQLRGKEVLHRIDNKNTEIILSVGSRKAILHNEAVNIFKLCQSFDLLCPAEIWKI